MKNKISLIKSNMEQPTLYEVLFEGKKLHICENCLNEGICEEIKDILPMDNTGQCEMWEDKENEL